MSDSKNKTASTADIEDLTAKSLFSCDDSLARSLVAVVTGGGTGIGLIIAKTLASNGAKVYITGRREEKLGVAAQEHGESTPGAILPLPGDVTSKDSIQKLVDDLKEKEGHVNILVNNAGIAGPKHDTHEDKANAEHVSKCLWEDQKFEDWGKLYATNVSALYFASVAFLPLLQAGTKKNKGYSSCILNISSISGLTKMAQNHIAYNSSKAAAIHMTRLMATEFAATKVRVNTIAPGLFPSEMTSEGGDEKNVSTLDKKLDIPAGRPGHATDMAGPVLLLTSQAGVYLNGIVLPVDGGWLLTTPGVI